MPRLISVHSFRRGTGKSTLTANLAVLLALGGRRVAVIDANLHAPSQHILFDLPEADIAHTLNDFVWGRCDIAQAAHERTGWLELERPGRLWLIPASPELNEISRVLRQDFDTQRLGAGLQSLSESLKLDVALVDTHAGVSETTLTSIAFSHTLLISLRPDRQDYQGTGVLVELARTLAVPRTLLVLNEVPPAFDVAEVQAEAEKNFQCPVAAVLPHAEEWMALASAGLFVIRFPDHPLAGVLQHLAARLMT